MWSYVLSKSRPKCSNLNLTAENCDANPTFQPIASGGDGIDVQFWYVGIDPTLEVIQLVLLLSIQGLIKYVDGRRGPSRHRSLKNVGIFFYAR